MIIDGHKIHPRLESVDNEGTDEGRWLVFLKPGWRMPDSPYGLRHGVSVGSKTPPYSKARRIALEAVACDCDQCKKD